MIGRGAVKPFSLLLKPCGAACNLRCRYCFYADHAPGVIAHETLAHTLDSYCALPFSAAEKSVALQGGEPLLAPDYVFDEMDAHPLSRSLQTNAMLLTRERAERLARGNWLVGASVDGPPELHDKGRGATFDAVERGIRLLEDAGVDYNLLTVVSTANVASPEEVYRFLKGRFATRFHQYIECTGPDPAWAVGGEAWGEFLVRLFDEWIKEDAHVVSIRLFDSIVSQLVRGFPTQCSFAETCRQYLVVEYDGSVYPCDFHVRPDLKLGNVLTHTWEELLSSPIYASFAAAKTEALPDECRNCEYFAFCRGDCPRNRRSLCKGWRRFFAHAIPRLVELVA